MKSTALLLLLLITSLLLAATTRSIAPSDSHPSFATTTLSTTLPATSTKAGAPSRQSPSVAKFSAPDLPSSAFFGAVGAIGLLAVIAYRRNALV